MTKSVCGCSLTGNCRTLFVQMFKCIFLMCKIHFLKDVTFSELLAEYVKTFLYCPWSARERFLTNSYTVTSFAGGFHTLLFIYTFLSAKQNGTNYVFCLALNMLFEHSFLSFVFLVLDMILFCMEASVYCLLPLRLEHHVFSFK